MASRVLFTFEHTWKLVWIVWLYQDPRPYTIVYFQDTIETIHHVWKQGLLQVLITLECFNKFEGKRFSNLQTLLHRKFGKLKSLSYFKYLVCGKFISFWISAKSFGSVCKGLVMGFGYCLCLTSGKSNSHQNIYQ
jgi:hypothetical protein